MNIDESIFPFYTSVTAEKPTACISLSELVDLAVNGVTVGDKKNTAALTPYKAQAKTKEAAKQSMYQALVIDHDDDDKTAMEIDEAYQGLAFLAFTTSSHQQWKGGNPPENRWKVIVPFSKAIPHNRFLNLSRGASLSMKGDLAQARVQQVFFAPNKLTEDSPYEYIDHTDREWLNPLDDDNPHVRSWLQMAKEQERLEAMHKARIKPKPRTSNNHGIIGKILDGYAIESLIAAHGYRDCGKAHLSPHSSTGTPGVYILNDGDKPRLYSHHGVSDPLSNLNHDGHALDAADVLCTLHYGGDFNAMIKAEAEALDPEGNKARQREWAEKHAQSDAIAEFSVIADRPDSKPFCLKQFSLREKAGEMFEQMLDDKFVLGQLAILGQETVIYAKPNSGKTLLTIWLLIEAIKAKDIDGENVFYINADDNFKGLAHKIQITQPYGIHMLAPGHAGFRTQDFLNHLSLLTKQDTARGVIIVLDTLKKFTDIMEKKDCSEFGKVVRAFVLKGGTVIMLAHTNKHKDSDGKPVVSGTSDIVDDVDCAYILDVKEDGAVFKTVGFENIKSRGDVAKTVAYRYSSSPADYQGLLDSIELVDETEAQKAAQSGLIREQLIDNKEAIEAISECISSGFSKKTELIDTACHDSGISKQRIKKVLEAHQGNDYAAGHRWIERKGERATKLYELLKPVELAMTMGEV